MFLILAGVAAFPALRAAEASSNLKKANTMQYALTPLEYGHSALEPWIDAETVGFHHDKHQAAYVANLNAALASEPSFKYEGDVCGLIMNLESVPEKIRTAVRNNGGGVWNHEFYWKGLSPNKTEPSAKLAEAVKKSFGSFDELKKQMYDVSVKQFGSGWGWLLVNPDGSLKIASTPNQDNPLMGKAIGACGCIPILTIDVWEHAYYLKYKNLRAEYAKNIWNLVDWKRVSERYESAVKDKKPLI